MRVIVAILIACVGCHSVQHSTLPPYVRELRTAPGGLEVIRCEIVHTKTERTSGWGVLGSLVLAMFLIESSPGTTTETRLSQGACQGEIVPTTVAEVAP